MAPRWRKVLTDITVNPGRSLLIVLAMAVGVCALSTLTFKHAILNPVLSTMHGESEPASATFFVDRVDDSLVDAVQQLPGVGQAEARPMIMARVNIGGEGADEWAPALLYVVRDFDAQRLDLFFPDHGTWPPAKDEVLLERSAVEFAGVHDGEELSLRIPGGGVEALRFTGTVHAPGLAPAWMEHVVYGFIRWDSSVRDGRQRESTRLLIRVAKHALEIGHIREISDQVENFIEARGYQVRRVDVPTPGRHPHAAQMDTFMYLLGTFALLAFLLSSVLVASMIQALQAEQVKQVGMMKAIGATTRQIAGVYLVHVGLLAFGAMCVGIPAGWFAGRAYAGFSAGILNANVARGHFPFWALFGIIAFSMSIPMLAALGPVLRASRITVREALAHDSGARHFGRGVFDRRLAKITFLPRPLLLILRTTLQRRTRLALTVGMLAIGGALFMAAVNVSVAWTNGVKDDFARRHFDLTCWFPEPVSRAEVDAAVADSPGVAAIEYWPIWSPFLIGDGGVATKRVTLLGVGANSQFLEPRIASGRWLDEATPNGIVINGGILALQRSLAVGDSVAVRLKGRMLSYPIIGIAKELSPTPTLYALPEAVIAAGGLAGEMTRSVRIRGTERGEEAQLALAAEFEERLSARSIEVDGIVRLDDLKGSVLDHLLIIQRILILAAGVVLLVASIGLISTLTINVLQRTREIGVMGAIGATSRTLASHVLCEGILIGLLSWLLATILSAPISYFLQIVTGRMFFKVPLDFTMSWSAVVIWLALVVLLAALSSFHPARRAARIPVREALDFV